MLGGCRVSPGSTHRLSHVTRGTVYPRSQRVRVIRVAFRVMLCSAPGDGSSRLDVVGMVGGWGLTFAFAFAFAFLGWRVALRCAEMEGVGGLGRFLWRIIIIIIVIIIIIIDIVIVIIIIIKNQSSQIIQILRQSKLHFRLRLCPYFVKGVFFVLWESIDYVELSIALLLVLITMQIIIITLINL